jgi:hypothetical protein
MGYGQQQYSRRSVQVSSSSGGDDGCASCVLGLLAILIILALCGVTYLVMYQLSIWLA